MNLIIAPQTTEWFPRPELAEVEQTITVHKRGQVRLMGTYWLARFHQYSGQTEALPGTTVKVIGRHGLTLLVMPLNNE